MRRFQFIHIDWISIMSHPNVLINIRRALVSLVAVRTLEPRLLPAIILHVSLQRLLVRVASVTSGTVVRYLAALPKRIVFVLNFVPGGTIICSQNIQYTGIVGLQKSSYKQEEGELRLVGRNAGRVKAIGPERKRTETRNMTRERDEYMKTTSKDPL